MAATNLGSALPCPLVDDIFWMHVNRDGMSFMEALAQTFELCDWCWVHEDLIFVADGSMNDIRDMETWDTEDYSPVDIKQHTWFTHMGDEGSGADTAGPGEDPSEAWVRTEGWAIPLELFAKFPTTLGEARRRHILLLSAQGPAQEFKKRRVGSVTGLVDLDSDETE